MRNAFLVATLGLALTGCSSGGDATSPTATPGVATTTPPQVQGPPTEGHVPAGAFVGPHDLGPGWTLAAGLAPPCAPEYARTALSSKGFTSDRGTLTETLATGTDVAATVRSWHQALVACAYRVQDDPLGDAGLIATSADKLDSLVVSGTEGVLVVVHAHGTLAASTDDLDGWADLALGTSCVAAPDGCH